MSALLDFEDEAAVYAAFLERGWGDGLPIVAPTRERVDAAIAAWGRDPDEALMTVPPSNAELTVAALAVNAVMAGCLPGHLPYVEAALLAMRAESYNLLTVQATTSPVAPLLLVNGPGAAALGMNAGTGAMGPGNRANATIGRAVRMVLCNLGEAQHWSNDRATSGLPTKYSWCLPENEAASPWVPFHTERGFRADEDVVTVFGGHGPITVVDPGDVPGEQLLTAISAAPTSVGTNLWFRPGGQLFILLSPDHAGIIARDGFSRADVRAWVHEHARLPIGQLRRSGYHELRNWPEAYERMADDEEIPLVYSPDEVLVAVAGGGGPYSHVVPSHGACGHSSSRRVRHSQEVRA